MTSNITNFSGNINASFPVPGQDNDSQGFRDNFSNTRSAFAEADAEISDLQSKVLLVEKLSPDTGPVDNDLKNSTINNGSYNNFFGVFNPLGSTSGTVEIPVDAGSLHTAQLVSGTVNFTFTNWPDSPLFGIVRVLFKGPLGASATPALFTANGGDIIKAFDFPTNFAVTLTKTTSGTQAGSQNEIVLTDATDLVAGMVVTATNVPDSPATTITSIDGNTVTLSQNLSASINTGVSIHFAYPNGRVVEAWTNNGGATVYVKHIGDF